ncbi:MAG: riboflavin synthase [Chloroflexi bacterium]|nr:riboflavin synthase [Chloroflexota bacterium]
MFSGIVEEMGRVTGKESSSLIIEAQKSLEGTGVGDSVAVNGVCLTVTSIKGGAFSVDITPETMKRTNLGSLKERDKVNLERSLTMGKVIGGHLVQGHIGGTGTVIAVTPEGNSLIVRFQAPEQVMRYVVEKGFIAVDGASLTIVSCDSSSFAVSLIPFTRDRTVLGSRKPGDLVNLEVDIIAKYVERLVVAQRTSVEVIDEM